MGVQEVFIEWMNSCAVGSRELWKYTLHQYSKMVIQAMGCRMHWWEGNQEGQMEDHSAYCFRGWLLHPAFSISAGFHWPQREASLSPDVYNSLTWDLCLWCCCTFGEGSSEKLDLPGGFWSFIIYQEDKAQMITPELLLLPPCLTTNYVYWLLWRKGHRLSQN